MTDYTKVIMAQEKRKKILCWACEPVWNMIPWMYMEATLPSQGHGSVSPPRGLVLQVHFCGMVM